MNRKYPIILEEEWGNNLQDLFGRAEDMPQKKSLASIAGNDIKINEIIKAIEKVTDGGVLDVYEHFGKNGRPTFLSVANEILKILDKTVLPNGKKLFEEYKLPDLGKQSARQGGAPVEWDRLYLRYPIQRAVKVWHIMKDILIDWDYDLNDPAYVRILSDGTMNVNDKQHGNFGRLIMGSPDVLIEGIESDDQSMDANMYASRNIHNLESGWENDANVRVERALDYEREGKIVKTSDQPYLDFYNILKEEDCSWQEKGLVKKPKVCQNGEKLYETYQQYGKELFVSAVKMNTQMWPHGELAREFVWFYCEAMKQWKPHFSDSDLREIRSTMKDAIKQSFPDRENHRNRATGPGTIWGTINEFMKSLPRKGDDKDWRHSVSPNIKGASAIRDLMLNYNAWMKSEKNRTPLKFDLPDIIDTDGSPVVIEMGVYEGGAHSKNAKAWFRNSTISKTYDHTEIDFDDEDESEAI